MYHNMKNSIIRGHFVSNDTRDYVCISCLVEGDWRGLLKAIHHDYSCVQYVQDKELIVKLLYNQCETVM